MKHERNGNRPGGSSDPMRRGGRQERGATDPLLALITTLVLLTASALVAIGAPHALEVATHPAYASSGMLTDSGLGTDEDPSAEADRDPEPFIVDDMRTEGVMYAYADVFCPYWC